MTDAVNKLFLAIPEPKDNEGLVLETNNYYGTNRNMSDLDMAFSHENIKVLMSALNIDKKEIIKQPEDKLECKKFSDSLMVVPYIVFTKTERTSNSVISYTLTHKYDATYNHNDPHPHNYIFNGDGSNQRNYRPDKHIHVFGPSGGYLDNSPVPYIAKSIGFGSVVPFTEYEPLKQFLNVVYEHNENFICNALGTGIDEVIGIDRLLSYHPDFTIEPNILSSDLEKNILGVGYIVDLSETSTDNLIINLNETYRDVQWEVTETINTEIIIQDMSTMHGRMNFKYIWEKWSMQLTRGLLG